MTGKETAKEEVNVKSSLGLVHLIGQSVPLLRACISDHSRGLGEYSPWDPETWDVSGLLPVVNCPDRSVRPLRKNLFSYLKPGSLVIYE